MSFKVVKIHNKIGYEEALNLQHKIYDLVKEGKYKGVLLILEHKHVLTLGIRTDINNLLVSEEQLKNQGVEIYKSDRGGDITYHGPGQIVAYPIFDLNNFEKSLHWYVDKLQEVVIKTLGDYDIDVAQKREYPGVWVNDSKICAIGVRVKRWITYHGFAFNVKTDKSFFNLINPCGITEFAVSSLDDFKNDIDIEVVKNQVINKFEEVFDIEFAETVLESL